jgi:large subunit ribosomal protein L22
VKINGKKLKVAAERAGLSTEALGGAIAAPGFGEKAAESAVRNWMSDRNHPRAKPEQIRRLAQAVGARPAELSRFVSVARFIRGSERKVRLVADMIRGLPVDRAMTALTFSDKRAAVAVRKSLSAAIADAEQADADVGALVVAESRVDAGPIIKRFQPKDRGRAHPIKKRMSHVVVGVEERK